MIKLGHKQIEILGKMTNGWELGISLGLHPNWWIQKGGLGKGGEAIHDLPSASMGSLYRNKLIRVRERSFPTEYWEITQLGVELLKQHKNREEEK